MFRKIYIEITNICNLNCKFCPETQRPKQYMSVENFEKIIDKIQKHTKLVCLHVKGEPLLHHELEKILEILEKYNLKANITTNGTLINEKIEIITNSKAIRQINFSIHSLTQNTTLNDRYLQNIFESAEKLKNVIISYRLWNQSNLNVEIIKTIENYYNIQNLSKNLLEKDFFKIRDNLFINQDTEFEWPNIKNEIIIEQGRCLALKEQIAILVDGTVVPCCLDNNGDIPIGNIFEETVDEILKKPRSIEIRKNFENGVITCNLCKTCGFLKRLENKRINANSKEYQTTQNI